MILLESELFRNFDVSKIINEDDEIVDNNSSLSLINNPQCLYIDRDKGILDFDIPFVTDVDFVTYWLDYNNAYYDREEEKYYNLNKKMLRYTGEVQGVAVLSLDVIFVEKYHVRINRIRHIEIFQDEINNNKENIKVEKIDFDCDDIND